MDDFERKGFECGKCPALNAPSTLLSSHFFSGHSPPPILADISVKKEYVEVLFITRLKQLFKINIADRYSVIF